MQAGLLMLLDGDFAAGLSVLQQLPLEVWQPCQLFGLFPALTARCVCSVCRLCTCGAQVECVCCVFDD